VNDGMMKKVAVPYQKEGEKVVFPHFLELCVFSPGGN